MTDNQNDYLTPVEPLNGNPDQIRAQWLAEEEARLNQRAFGGSNASWGYPQVNSPTGLTGGSDPYWPVPTVSTRPRPTTIVWGFLVAAIGVLALTTATGIILDPGAALISVLAAGGVGLIGAAIFNGVRRRPGKL